MELTSNKDYWAKRMAALEDEQYQRSAAYYKDVQKQFRLASNDMQMDIERWYQRLADNNDISYAGAKKLLKKGELEEFHWTVEQYIKAGEENAIDRCWMKELENASARHHISYLEAMKLQAQQHAELLSTEFEGGMTHYLHKAYGQQYYHTAYEIAKGTGVGSNLAKLDTRKIDAMLRKPWAQDGANFSDRIWANKQKLVNTLHTELTQNIIRGASPQKAIDNITKTMEVSRNQAGRLIMTESAAVSSAAQKDCLKELGVGRYEILATLDSHTSEICRYLDGKVFDMKEYAVGVTAPPFHPNCRSTTVPYFEDEFTAGEQRAARNEATGKTYYVPADMKYQEWKKHYVSLQADSIINSAKKKIKGALVDSKIVPFNELPSDITKEFDAGLKKADKNTALILQRELGNTDFYLSNNRKSEYIKGINAIGIAEKSESSTVAHELFHKIDMQYNVTKQSSMIKAFNMDFNQFEDITLATRQKFPDAFELSDRGRYKLKAEYRGVSDMISALSNGEVNLGYGHSKKYWNKYDGIQMQEIWAQYGRIYYDNNPEVVKMAETLFPSGTQRVNMKLRRLVENVDG